MNVTPHANPPLPPQGLLATSSASPATPTCNDDLTSWVLARLGPLAAAVIAADGGSSSGSSNSSSNATAGISASEWGVSEGGNRSS